MRGDREFLQNGLIRTNFLTLIILIFITLTFPLTVIRSFGYWLAFSL